MVVARDLAHGDVVNVNMLAGEDGPGDDPDDLIVPAYSMPHRKVAKRDLVAARYGLAACHVIRLDKRTGRGLLQNDGDIIFRRQDYCADDTDLGAGG
jgi:hypothetical protein